MEHCTKANSHILHICRNKHGQETWTTYSATGQRRQSAHHTPATGGEPTNQQQLRDAIMSIWTNISEECFQNLVESMP